MAKLRVQFHDPMHGTQEIPQHTLKQDMEKAGVTNIGDAVRRLRASSIAVQSWGAGLTWHLDYSEDNSDFGNGLNEDDMMFGVSTGG